MQQQASTAAEFKRVQQPARLGTAPIDTLRMPKVPQALDNESSHQQTTYQRQTCCQRPHPLGSTAGEVRHLTP
jgi:hypothetical protein